MISFRTFNPVDFRIHQTTEGWIIASSPFHPDHAHHAYYSCASLEDAHELLVKFLSLVPCEMCGNRITVDEYVGNLSTCSPCFDTSYNTYLETNGREL